MKITKTVKVRVVEMLDGRFAVEYKGLLFWRSCYYLTAENKWPWCRERRNGDFPATYDEVYEAIAKKDEYLWDLRDQRKKKKTGPVAVKEYFCYKD